MKDAKVIFLTRINQTELQEKIWEHIPPGFHVLWLNTNEMKEDEIIDQMRDTDFLFPLGALVPEQALREAKQLKLIQLFSQGYDRIPLALTLELGIPVANIGGANAITVSEQAVMLMLALLRRLCPSITALKQGKSIMHLDRRQYHQLHGKVVGIIGLGNIGCRVAKIVHSFDARVIFHEKAEVPRSVVNKFEGRLVGLEELLGTADIVTLHVPLLESTRGMIGWEQFKLMKPSAILINTSRGSVVDEEALIKALQQKEIAGAGLDVFTKEPPELDNPLLSMENVVATPHLGGFAWDNLDARLELIWGNVKDVWKGKPPRYVVTEP